MTTTLMFIHGINNDANERSTLKERVEKMLYKFDVKGFDEVAIGDWPSCGDFIGDVIQLHADVERRGRIIQGLADKIKALQCSKLVVAGHSFGQVLSLEALITVARSASGKQPRPTSLMTLGGPLGNNSPFFRGYLAWVRRHSNARPSDFGVNEWWDVRNPDDPIPVNPFVGYSPPVHATAMSVSYPGTPLLNPLAEHGSYFDIAEVYRQLEAMARRLS